MSYEWVEYFDSSSLIANAIHLWLFCLIAFSSLIPITSPKVLFPAISSCISLLYQWRDGYKQVRPILSTLGASFASIWFFVFLKLLLKVKKCDAALSQMFLWIKIKEETFRPLNIDFTLQVLHFLDQISCAALIPVHIQTKPLDRSDMRINYLNTANN